MFQVILIIVSTHGLTIKEILV